MSEIVKEITYLVDILPEQDQALAYELIKKMVLAWDPDFTKLTELEKNRLNIAETELKKGEVYSHDEVWN